jgi:hypothetical protein
LNAAIDVAIDYIGAMITAENEANKEQEEYILAVDSYLDAFGYLKAVWNEVFADSYGEYSELKYSNLTEADKSNPGFDTVEKAFGEEREKAKDMNNAQIQLTSAQNDIKLKKKEALPYRNAVLDLWAQTAKYKTMHAKFASATSFSFLRANEDIKDANKFARSFIYANIFVSGDANREFGNEVYEILKVLVPEYVSANMAVPSGYTGTSCQRISHNDEPVKVVR